MLIFHLYKKSASQSSAMEVRDTPTRSTCVIVAVPWSSVYQQQVKVVRGQYGMAGNQYCQQTQPKKPTSSCCLSQINTRVKSTNTQCNLILHPAKCSW